MAGKLFMLGIITLLCNLSVAQVEYKETQDDFSNDIVYSLKISSVDGEPGVIFIACFPENNLNIQLAISGTMFPNDVKDEGMIISTTHKFNKAEEAVTSNWFMNMMKYKNSWYTGDKVTFAKYAAISNQLNLRLNKRNEVYKFDLSGTAEPLKKILMQCGEEIQ